MNKPPTSSIDMTENLSQYAEEQLVKFLQNKQLQYSINDMVAWMNMTDLDEVVNVCITMFLANIDILKLHPNDLAILKSEIRRIREVKPHYPINTEVIPEPTDDFITSKFEERLKAGYSSGYKKVIDPETNTVRIPL